MHKGTLAFSFFIWSMGLLSGVILTRIAELVR